MFLSNPYSQTEKWLPTQPPCAVFSSTCKEWESSTEEKHDSWRALQSLLEIPKLSASSNIWKVSPEVIQAALGIANATKENAMKETLSTELAAGP
jgi:hypothetical protein